MGGWRTAVDKTNLSLATAGGATGHVKSFTSATVRKLCICLCYAVHITYFVAAAYY